MVTIRDIAKMAGVSTATVSRVVNDRGFVKEKTRKKIAALIREHNYVVPDPRKRRGPKPNSSTLLKYRSFSMVWAGGLEASRSLTGHAMMVGISGALNELGASLNVDMARQDGELPEALRSRRIDGIFLCGGIYSEAFLQHVKDLPVVWLLQRGTLNFGDRVQPDHEQVGRMSYEYLRRKGCRKLCCVSCRGNSRIPVYWQSRAGAFCREAKYDDLECHLIDLDYVDDLMSPVEVQAKAAREAVKRIREISGVDGVFVANNLGLPVYSELMANGTVPSKDVEMVAGDIELCGGYLNPEPVRVDIHAQEIGAFAVEAMMWRLQHPEAHSIIHLQQPSLVIPAK